jgi:hypothetical protein
MKVLIKLKHLLLFNLMILCGAEIDKNGDIKIGSSLFPVGRGGLTDGG